MGYTMVMLGRAHRIAFSLFAYLTVLAARQRPQPPAPAPARRDRAGRLAPYHGGFMNDQLQAT